MADLDAVTPKKFCENETVNLLCSSYDSKAQRMGVRLEIKAILPKNIPLTDTELCSVISNGLENALRAVSQPEVSDKWVEFYCEAKQNKLFIQIKNPYAGQVVIRDGLPVSSREGHGYGCYSIQTITQRNGGLCSFEAENGVFSLRLSFPLPDDYGNQETNNTRPKNEGPIL
jgi:sensor histidine kinase regulating citrate/malate metabolism